MAECRGKGPDHCCWFQGKACEFLVDTGRRHRRRWVCSLRDELGSWEAVHVDRRYLDTVRPKLDDIGIEVDCGDWPTPGEQCATCGVMG